MRRTGPPQDLGPVARLVVDDFRAAPCACVGAALHEGGGWRYGFGVSGRLWFAEDAPSATCETIFDLASVTKPITAMTLARLERRRVVSRHDPLGKWLPSLYRTRSGTVSLDLLAAHRAGLDAHRLFYEPLTRGEPVDLQRTLEAAADARRPDCDGDPPIGGFSPLYSDLGYLLLGAALEAASAEDLDRLMVREVVTPIGATMGSSRLLRRTEASFERRVAPTEYAGYRGGLVRGAVHDDNAWALVGHAAAGHAGFFGDARSVVALGTHLLDAVAGRSHDFLTAAQIAPFIAVRPGGSLLAGFDRRSGDVPSSGRRFGPNTFGHLGFTGTSIWMDPDRDLVGVLLTNRVHPSRESTAIRRARPAAYDAIFERMLAG